MEQREERRAGESSRGEAGLGNRAGEEQGRSGGGSSTSRSREQGGGAERARDWVGGESKKRGCEGIDRGSPGPRGARVWSSQTRDGRSASFFLSLTLTYIERRYILNTYSQKNHKS